MEREKLLAGVAVLLALITVGMGMEPSFGQTGGAPIGVGIAAAGFAIASALASRQR
jgi:hypothetical protein